MTDRPLTEEKQFTDSERLDWLEKYARKPNGLLLHAETKSTGRPGLGLALPPRSLREAVDQAMEYENG